MGKSLYRVVAPLAGLALAVLASYLIGGALGWWSLTSAFAKADVSVVITAGATVALAAFGMLGWAANQVLATATERLAEQGEQDRRSQRAELTLVYDETMPMLRWDDLSYIRVMVENKGPAMAENVVVTLERIEPATENPMLHVTIGGTKGINVLPSSLVRKGKRDPFERCNINPKSRAYFDVIVWQMPHAANPDITAAFQIEEADALHAHLGTPKGSGPLCPLVWEKEYDLHITAAAANAEPVSGVFKMQATRGGSQHFRFSQV
jgi:hypothetical protein